MATIVVARPSLWARLVQVARRPMSFWQRLAVAVVYAGLAAWLVHPWIAMQLVIYGNDALTVGDPAYARHLYDRALWLDSRNRFAAEGWMMATTELRRPGSDKLAMHFATRYLARDPEAIEVRRLLAVAEWHSGARVQAAIDYNLVARMRGTDIDWEFALSSAVQAGIPQLQRAARVGLAHVAPDDPLLRRRP